MMFVETEDLIAQLELVDSIRKLGLTNYFEKEIKETLGTIASVENSNPCISITDDLYTMYFNIFRQQGYKVSQGKYLLVAELIVIYLYELVKNSHNFIFFQIYLVASWMRRVH